MKTYVYRREVSVHKRQKVGFAISLMVAMVGAMLLIASQIPLRTEYYDLVDTRSFSPGQQLTFYWTFEPNVRYRFEVRANWTSPPPYSHELSIGNTTYLLGSIESLVQPPWVWYWTETWPMPETWSVTFWHYGTTGQEIEQATTLTHVEISEYEETTAKPTYLIYVGLPFLILGAILTTIVGKARATF